jgi:hypothetical protein
LGQDGRSIAAEFDGTDWDIGIVPHFPFRGEKRFSVTEAYGTFDANKCRVPNTESRISKDTVD